MNDVDWEKHYEDTMGGLLEEIKLRQSAEQRIQQLEEALREVQKRVESYDMYLADMEGKIDSGIREIRYIVDAVLASEAPEKEGREDG